MKPSVEKSLFGTLADGTSVDLYTLANSRGRMIKVTNFGTIITEVHVPDRQGNLGDVVLGFDDLQGYVHPHPYFGCTVGRYANRISKGRFTLDGKSYELAVNNGPNHLHGGLKGFDKAVWHAAPSEALGPKAAAVEFKYLSPDGEEGYPGNLQLTVLIGWSEEDELCIDYTATTDKPTPINLTNHSYFNLAGQGDVLGHEMMISADFYTPVNEHLIPTGELKPVRGTPLDFTTPKPIGSRFGQLGNTPVGYDHNYVINRAGKGLALASRVFEPGSGRVMETRTTQPGVQFYTGNFLDGTLTGRRGVRYAQHSGFCLETQHYPDSVNHHSFPTTILRPGQTFKQTTVYKFSTR